MAKLDPSKYSARIIDGRAIAKHVRARVKTAVERLAAESGVTPTLLVIRVGDNPASQIYVRHKKKACAEVGITSLETHLPGDVSAEELTAVIRAANIDDDVDAILLQLPLPDHLVPRDHLHAIHPDKDADGFHPLNLGRLVVWDTPLRPCTPAGVLEMLHREKIPLRGVEAVVISRSVVVGRPMAQLLLKYDATVTLVHRHTVDLESHIRRADLVIAAAGVPGLVKGEWIKPGATVIDVGITRLPGKKLSGDVEFEVAAQRAGAISPVPGGVGPMTIAMLLENTVIAARLRRGLVPESGLGRPPQAPLPGGW